MELDIIIRNGAVIDGSGAPRFAAELGIRGDTIAAVGDLGEAGAGLEIEARGLAVAPGFIDIHTHSDTTILAYPEAESRIRQGVTTDVVGNCSYSAFPVTEACRKFMAPLLQDTLEPEEWSWSSLAEYRDHLERRGLGVNVAPLVGHGALRIAAMGLDNRPPSRSELETMQALAEAAIEEGAFGVTTGLTLAPSSFAGTEELVAVSQAVARRGGFYATHSRLWSGYHFESVEEAIEIGRRAGLPIQVSHQTIIDPRYYGQAARIVERMEEARGQGIDVRYDVYPYAAGGTQLDQLLPDWALEGGHEALLARLRDPQTRARIREDARPGWFRGIPWKWDAIHLAYIKTDNYASWLGRSLEELADSLRQDPLEVMLELIDREDNQVGVVMFNRDERDIRHFLSHPLSLFGSDGSALSPRGRALDSRPHPRYYGTFPRLLGRYCRELGLFSLEEAVHKMTGGPAARLGLKDRGLIRAGMKADLTLFEPDRVADRATFEDPHQFPTGIQYVLVNGRLALTPQGRTKVLAGRALGKG